MSSKSLIVLSLHAVAIFTILDGSGLCALAGDKKNLILITVDTLRADHLSLYGYKRDTSPNLDQLAREGIWFTRCYSQSAITGSSHASIFTSLYPQTTGVLSNKERFPASPSLMDRLREEGYMSGGFISSIVVGKKFGIDSEFDHFDDDLTHSEINRPRHRERAAPDTLKAAVKWLSSRSREKPVFLWIHLIDPHGPYLSPSNPDRYVGDQHYSSNDKILKVSAMTWVFDAIPFYQKLQGKSNSSYYIAHYDAEIRDMDDSLGTFFTKLKELKLYDSSIIVVTSDHGETLSEKGHRRYFSHGLITYEEDLRVPLIIKDAKDSGSGGVEVGIKIDLLAQTMDIAPSLYHLLGLQKTESFQGINLFSESHPSDYPVFSFGAYGSEKLEKINGTQFTVLKGPWRYIRNTLNGEEELYDHRNDPHESENIAASKRDITTSLRGELDWFFENTPRSFSPAIVMSPDLEEKLRGLGYSN